MNTSLSTIASGIAGHLPFLLVLLVGAVMAVMSWSKHPRVSLLALLGAAIMGGVSLLSIVWYYLVLPQMISRWGGGMEHVFVYTVSNVVLSILDAAGLGCVFAAVFTRRQAENK